MKVQIISRELITPSSPTPSNLKIYELSCIDQIIPPFYVPLIFYYSNDDIPRSNMLLHLKKSLSEALNHYYPLAGRMAQCRCSLECNDQGVVFSEAQVDSDISDIIMCPKIGDLNQLIPCKLSGVELSTVEEQLAIQVNLFKCGGVAIGVCVSHRIADACTLTSFMRAWAAISNKVSEWNRPVFNSSSLFPPVHSLEYGPNPRNPAIQPPAENLATKRFLFTASAIDALKVEVESKGFSEMRPSRVEVVTALIWRCGMSVLEKCKTSVAFHVVNLRERALSSLDQHSFGNIFQMAKAFTDRETMDMASLVGKLRAAFAEINGEYVRGLVGDKGFELVKNNFGEIGRLMSQEDVGVFRFSSWCRFPMYQVDFGWGKPSWVSIAGFAGENSILLVDSRREGGIEAWVVMDEKVMERLEQITELQAFIT